MQKPTVSHSLLGAFDLGLPWWCDGAIKRVLGLQQLEALYRHVGARLRDCDPNEQSARFPREALAALGHHWIVDSDSLHAIRALDGPVVFVSNHPFGALDALILLDLMAHMRAQCILVANAIVSVIPELAPSILSVNIMTQHASTAHAENRVALLQLMRHLKRGGSVGMFPAGEVAIPASWRSLRATDKAWHPHVGALVHRAKATVVPVYIAGQNSRVFQALGRLSPRMALPLLARELLRARAPVQVTVGAPMPYACMAHMSPITLAAHLQAQCLALREPRPRDHSTTPR